MFDPIAAPRFLYAAILNIFIQYYYSNIQLTLRDKAEKMSF